MSDIPEQYHLNDNGLKNKIEAWKEASSRLAELMDQERTIAAKVKEAKEEKEALASEIKWAMIVRKIRKVVFGNIEASLDYSLGSNPKDPPIYFETVHVIG